MTNQPFTEKSLLGQWTLMFFGYAQCPEICPKTLIKITELWKQVPQDLHFVFVSLDPESDTVQILRDFLGRFNSEFRGLTGEAAVIQKLAKACGIYSWQDPKANDPSKPKMIDHSAATRCLFTTLSSRDHGKRFEANIVYLYTKSIGNLAHLL